MSLITKTKSEIVYTTEEGYDIPLEGYTSSFLNNLEYDLSTWLCGNSEYPLYDMDEEEIQYILNHMNQTQNDKTIPSGSLTRVETGTYFKEAGLQEGDLMSGNQLLRSFSKEVGSTKKIFESKNIYWDNTDGWVIYRTKGNVPFFDPTKFSNPYPDQKEVFVPVDTMRVDKISHYTFKEANELATDLDIEPMWITTDVTVVDLVYDPGVSTANVGEHVVSTRNLLSSSGEDLSKVPRRMNPHILSPPD